jgi:hypothetical protein
MAITQITSNILSTGAAQNNLNAQNLISLNKFTQFNSGISGSTRFVNPSFGSNNVVTINGTGTVGTILSIAGTASAGGSLFQAFNNSSIGVRITEAGNLSANGSVGFNRAGGASISLGGQNNTNLFSTANAGSHTATDFSFQAGTSNRTSGNLFQISNFTAPVFTISTVSGGGDINISGNTTITGNLTSTGPTIFNSSSVTAPNLTPSASTSLMTRSNTEEFLLWTPNIMQYFPTAGSVTNGGFNTVSVGQSANIGLGTQSSGTSRLTLVNDWQFSSAAGSSMRFDRPFKVRIPMNCNMNYPDTTGQAACRIYVGSNGSFTLPYAGQEPYPTGTRGVGVEWRKASGSFQQEFRLFARNGTSSTTGQFIATNYTGFGPNQNNNSKFYDLLLTFNVDTPTNPIVNLYGSAWVGSNDLVPTRHSSTPILTLTGLGVPTGSAAVATNWGRIEAAIVGDNGPIPPQSSTTLNYFRTIYLQQA